MSMAVHDVLWAEVRTSAGLRSVRGMKPGTSVSAVQSQDCAAAYTSGVIALWFTRPGAAQAKGNRVKVLLRLQHGPVVRVEAPHPGVTRCLPEDFVLGSSARVSTSVKSSPRYGAVSSVTSAHYLEELSFVQL